MYCQNQKCRKNIRNFYTCSICTKSFCSNSCLNIHSASEHQKEVKSVKERASVHGKSIFLRAGKFVKEVKEDPLFNIKNFEFVKQGKKNYVIGNGAFGEVLLAKNIKDGKHYAIKYVNFL